MKLANLVEAEKLLHELKGVEAFLAVTKYPLQSTSISFSTYNPPTYNPKLIVLGHGSVDYNTAFHDEKLKADIVQAVEAYKCRLESEVLAL